MINETTRIVKYNIIHTIKYVFNIICIYVNEMCAKKVSNIRSSQIIICKRDNIHIYVCVCVYQRNNNFLYLIHLNIIISL